MPLDEACAGSSACPASWSAAASLLDGYCAASDARVAFAGGGRRAVLAARAAVYFGLQREFCNAQTGLERPSLINVSLDDRRPRSLATTQPTPLNFDGGQGADSGDASYQ